MTQEHSVESPSAPDANLANGRLRRLVQNSVIFDTEGITRACVSRSNSSSRARLVRAESEARDKGVGGAQRAAVDKQRELVFLRRKNVLGVADHFKVVFVG
jgi:hypothetical protein